MHKTYIEREAAMPPMICIGISCQECPFYDSPMHGGCKVAEFIVDIPAADVVEVVRCRECRFAPSGTDDSVEQGFGLEWPDDNWPYHTNPCPYWCEDEYYSHKPEQDFFCAFGKRKDGGQDDV